MSENSDQDKPMCSRSSSECQSRSWLLYGFPPGHCSTTVAGSSCCVAPLTLSLLFAHGPYLHVLLGSLGWQNGPQSRLWCFAGLFPPVLISEGHNFCLVTCPGKCSPLSRSLIFLDGWFVKQIQSKLSPFFPVASLGFTLLFNRPPVFSIRQVSCLMCISLWLWWHCTESSHACKDVKGIYVNKLCLTLHRLNNWPAEYSAASNAIYCYIIHRELNIKSSGGLLPLYHPFIHKKMKGTSEERQVVFYFHVSIKPG